MIYYYPMNNSKSMGIQINYITICPVDYVHLIRLLITPIQVQVLNQKMTLVTTAVTRYSQSYPVCSRIMSGGTI